MARSRRRQPPPQRLILDSGAVIGVARRDQRARAHLTAAWEVGAEVAIPAVVLAETIRGNAKDAAVNRVIKAVGQVLPTDESVGRRAGSLLGVARSDATVDSIVVATTINAGGGVILTGDPNDLRRLAGGHNTVIVQAI